MRAKHTIGKLALSGALILFGAGSAFAQDIGVTINGDPVRFAGIGPQQIQGRVLVPVRGVLERLGANVAWVPQTHAVVASTGSLDIELRIGDRRATINGKEALLDVPAQIIAGSTMVPLRFLGEALGANVGWDGQTRTVQIVTQGQQNPPSHDGQRPHPPPASQSNYSPAPSWAVGRFQGHSERSNTTVYLDINQNGHISLRSGNSRQSGGFRNDRSLEIEGTRFSVQREGNGFRTTQTDNRSNQVLFQRY